ncbi:MAG: response regulator transcription factor [Desulfobacula sp.]|uniref:response regulator n=1 Tax=Desulfobacula sp. TaxID=2593537 RepID=UPI0025C40274|nr:response regulator transcription factor [Desulfobacula sp.]MCD4722558.1 response regulator transcription factor [Desulfobacula sp.]
MSITILLADDHKLVREGLCSMLEKETDMVVMAQTDNGREAARLADKLNPDIVVLDINMPDLNGIDAAKLIRKNNPDIRIIALSVHSGRRFVTGMLKAGAAGYLVKHCAYEELARAIRLVADNKFYLSPQIHGVMIKDCISNSLENQDIFSSILTPREREVLQLVAEGTKSKDIAARLFVSIKTISTHRQQIMTKLNLNNVAELTLFAIREGLISIDD